MPITSGSIDINKGITTPQGITITWDDFNNASLYSPSQQQQILSSMGLTGDEITQLQGALQKTEMGQYSQYQQQQAFNQKLQPFHEGHGFWGKLAADALDVVTGRWSPEGKALWDPILKGEAAIAGVGPPDQSLAQLQQKGGLTDLVKKLGAASAVSEATGAGQQQPAPPAYSLQNLNAYTQNFLIPFVDHVNSMVKGDLNNWGSAINKMTSQLGIPANVAGNLVPTQAETALYQTLAPELAQQAVTQDYVNAANQQMSQSAAIGARYATQGSALQNLAAQGLITINPALSGVLSGGITNTSVPGSSPVQNMVQQPSLDQITRTLTPSP